MSSSSRQQDLALLPSNTIADRAALVRVEKNLNSFGFFTPSHKRLESLNEKTVTVFVRDNGGQRTEARATILPNKHYGLPTTADQDKYFAFQKIVQDLRWREGQVTNPVSFSSAEMLRLIGRKKSGQGYKEIADWMERMTLTGIRSEGVVYLAGSRKYMRDTFTVFSRVVTVGREMPDGSRADRNYVWLSDWQLENLNASYVLPIDYDAYRSLRLNISKALLPLIQIWFYASSRASTFRIEKRYSNLCELLSIRRYQHLSKIKEILAPSLDELQQIRILETWEVQKTVDGQDYKVVLSPGDRFLSQHRLRNQERPHHPEALSALLQRGIHPDRARKILAHTIDPQTVLDLLEYGDAEIHRRSLTRDPIHNPPGFFIYLLESNFPIPPTFETTRRRALKQQPITPDQQNELRLEILRQDYTAYCETAVDRWLQAHYSEAQLQSMAQRQRSQVEKEFAHLTLPPSVLDELSWRRLREEHTESAGILPFESFSRQSHQLPLL